MLQPSAYNEVNMVFGEKRKTNYYYIPYCACVRAYMCDTTVQPSVHARAYVSELHYGWEHVTWKVASKEKQCLALTSVVIN